MKKTIFFLIVILAMHSCFEPEPEDITKDYITKNITTHNVKLVIFYKDYNNQNKDTIFTLSPYKEIKQRYINRYVEYPFGIPADSCYIIFDESRQITYKRDDGNLRNILDVNNYEGGLVKGKWYQYKYYITNEDYSNAIVIK